MLHAALVVCLVAAPTPTPVKDLVSQLDACKDEVCRPYMDLISRGAKVWPDLAVGLEAPSEMTRFWTIGVLAAVRNPAARERLLDVLKNEPLVRVRAAAAFALGNLAKPDVSQAVLDGLTGGMADPDVNVRFESVSAIGRLAVPASKDLLIKALQDQSEDVRSEAVDGLSGLGEPSVRAALEERLKVDFKPSVRMHAAMALGRMRMVESVPLLIKTLTNEFNPQALAAVCWALGAIGDQRAKEPLKALLTHKEDTVRQGASEALAQLEPPTPLPPKH